MYIQKAKPNTTRSSLSLSQNLACNPYSPQNQRLPSTEREHTRSNQNQNEKKKMVSCITHSILFTLTHFVCVCVNSIPSNLFCFGFQSVTLHTNLGDIKCEIFCDEVPKTSEVLHFNFTVFINFGRIIALFFIFQNYEIWIALRKKKKRLKSLSRVMFVRTNHKT